LIEHCRQFSWVRGRGLTAGATLVGALMSAGLAFGQGTATPVGVWLVASGDAAVAITDCGGELCGKIVWLKEPLNSEGKPKRDVHNTDPAQRERPICGLPLLYGFKPEGDGRWSGGYIYNPRNGKTYHATITAGTDGTLKLRGYVGLPIFGESQTWTPVRTNLPDCSAAHSPTPERR